MINLSEYLNESMYGHIQLQDYIESMIFEKHGSFEGCEQQAKQIAKIVSDACYKTDKSFIGDLFPEDIFNKNYKNIFYKQFKLIINRNHNDTISCAYNPKPSKLTFLKDENKIGIIEIKMEIPVMSNFKSVKIDLITPKLTTQLQHELTHAWEDYNRLLNNKESLFDIAVKNNEYKLPNNYDIVSEYNYFFNKQEINAHIAEFKAYLEQHPIKTKEYEQDISQKLFNTLKETQLYKKYVSLINSIINIKNDDLIKFKQLNKFSNMTENKIKKHLIDDAEKLKRKLENVLPKMIYDYIEVEFNKPIIEKLNTSL